MASLQDAYQTLSSTYELHEDANKNPFDSFGSPLQALGGNDSSMNIMGDAMMMDGGDDRGRQQNSDYERQIAERERPISPMPSRPITPVQMKKIETPPKKSQRPSQQSRPPQQQQQQKSQIIVPINPVMAPMLPQPLGFDNQPQNMMILGESNARGIQRYEQASAMGANSMLLGKQQTSNDCVPANAGMVSPSSSPPKAKKQKSHSGEESSSHTLTAMSKFIVMILVILTALGVHSIIEYALSQYITRPSWTFGRELMIRFIYPSIALLLMFILVRFMWG